MKKMMKTIVPLLVVLAMLSVMPAHTFAYDQVSPSYVVTYQATPITDIEGLAELAVSQKPLAVTLSEPESDLLVAKQLLEVREYDDGSIEKDFALSTLSLGIDGEKALYEHKNDNHVAGYNVSHTFYYTAKGVGPNLIEMTYTFQAKKVVTAIVKNGNTGVTVTSANHGYRCRINEERWSNIYFNNSSPSGGQSFTINSSHPGFYTSVDDFLSGLTYGVGAQTVVNFSNGDYVIIQSVATFDPEIEASI